MPCVPPRRVFSFCLKSTSCLLFVFLSSRVCVCDQLLGEATAVTGVGVASLRRGTAPLASTPSVAMKREGVDVEGRPRQTSGIKAAAFHWRSSAGPAWLGPARLGSGVFPL